MKTIRGNDAVFMDKGNGSALAEFICRNAGIERSVYGIARTRLNKGAFEEKHHHNNTEEIYLFVKGSCVMRINGTEERFSAGDLLVAETGDEHEILEALEDTEFWVLTVPAFDPEDYIVG